jgi:putative ABC transport system permease protein
MERTPSNGFGALFHPWTWRMAWRDSRNQRARLALYTLSIAAGICSLTAIHALKQSVQTGIDTQSKSLLGADVLVSSRHNISEEKLHSIAHLVRETAHETAFSSMLSVPSNARTRLVQVRAIEGGYPFGTQVVSNPPDAWEELHKRPGILLEPALMIELGVSKEDKVKIGSLELTVLGSVSKGIPRSNRFSGFAPEVFIRQTDLEATGLAGAQSLVNQHVAIELVAKNQTERKTAVAELRKVFSENGVQMQTPENRREVIGEGLDKAQEFLGITALAALVLGGIGVAGAIHTHISRRLPTVAILLCLGCQTRVAMAVYLIQASILGLIGAIVGAGGGALAHAAAVHFAAASLPVSVHLLPDPLVLLETAMTGFVLCCGFALQPLLGIQDVSPASILSQRPQTLSQSKLRNLAIFALVLGLVWATARLNGSNALRASGLTLGLVVAFSLLTATALGLMTVARKFLRPSWSYVLRQGVSNLFRPQNQTLLFLLSLGLGVFLLLSTWMTQSLVLGQLRIDIEESTPNLYLIDIQPDQTESVGNLLKAQQLPLFEDSPMVTMRIASVKGLPLSALEERSKAKETSATNGQTQRVPRWVMEREYRSSYRNTLNASETVIAGTWPPAVPSPEQPVPLSIEQQLAKDLRVGLGDELVLDVQGIPIKTRVACLRKVDWSKFNLNFFMIFPTGVLENAPQFHLITTRVPNQAASAALQRAILQTAPNVSVVDLTTLLATISEQLQKASRIIQLLAGFTLLTGLPILIAALLNGRDQRIQETVLLRTLGASEKQVRAILLIEYSALGLLAGLTGCTLAVIATWAESRWIFKTSAPQEWGVLLLGLLLTLGASIAAGTLITRGICRHSPLSILRGS